MPLILGHLYFDTVHPYYIKIFFLNAILLEKSTKQEPLLHIY
jgi:hypothetical protein